METEMVKFLFCWVLLWTAAFLAVRAVFPQRSYNLWNRIISTLHAVVAVALASLSIKDWTCPFCPLASSSSPAQMKTLGVTLAYLIYDLIFTVLYKHCTLDNALHHIVSIIGLGAGLAYQKCLWELVASLWITEISSPFLHARDILKEFGIRDTDLNLLMDVLFAVTFSVARMVGGPYIVYVTLTADNPFLIKAMALGLQFVSVFWFYKILKMVYYKLGRSRRRNTFTPHKTN
ncbi:hypothetical protein LUZ61_004406 [Rhynchospora tenuis]|uniref:TLC domain-containing protein n=1 Tax=Rhynchospora tenuis TaxID=198213 RepID=A0AAD5ZMS6_9POAL|nr:hypothetical protein LUZ61_004406 [Rhynchospora tenuis]